MPWKECHIMDERVRFVARLLDGEKMAPLCAEFGISRKPGYKLYDRYKDCGADGLTDRSRPRWRSASTWKNTLGPVKTAAWSKASRHSSTRSTNSSTRTSIRFRLPALNILLPTRSRSG